ncbi:MAG: porin [Bacteroidales bacterium]
MNFSRLCLAFVAFFLLSYSLSASNASSPCDTVALNTKESSIDELPKFSNIKVRALMRTEFRAEADRGEDLVSNFRLKPAMIDLSGDLGKHISFLIRQRFDWSTEIQSDGVPLSTPMAQIQIKANSKLSFTLGKQMMTMGGSEFCYNPAHVFHYSLFLNSVQLFQTGASVRYSEGIHRFAAQVTKVTNSNFQVEGYKSAWNSTVNWGADFFSGFFRTNYSYMLTNAGEGELLHSVMLGHQFNFRRLKFELDLFRQNSMRYYSGLAQDDGSIQARTTERSLVGFAEYIFPGDRFLLGVKGALDGRKLSDSGDVVANELTASAQLRYRLFPKYGVTLHIVYAHCFDRSNGKYGTQFDGKDSDMLHTGLVWDFTHSFKRK